MEAQHGGRFALTNGRLILPDQVVARQALVIDGGRIAGITGAGSLPAGMETVDVGGRLVAPGLVDVLAHGALGYSFSEASEEAFAAITQENLRHGVTSMLAAMVTRALPDLVGILNFGRRWMAEPRPGARVLGMYMEGPYISPAQAGALDPRHILSPNDGTAATLLAHHDVLRVMALAPELPGALDLIDQMNAVGIIPAAGHSSGQDVHLRAAMQHGLSHIHHIWSGQSMMVREGPWRRPGLLEATLAFDGLTAEMICNNKHLPATLMKLAYKAMGPDRLCAVSDATPGAGLPEGAHFRMGGMEYDVHDGIGMMLDRSAFAGSTTLLNEMVPILRGVVGVPLPAAVRMVTLTPARILNVHERKGSLEAGKDADISVFDEDWRVWRVMMGGKWAYTPGA